MKKRRESIYTRVYHYFLQNGSNKCTRYLYSYLSKKDPMVAVEVNEQRMLLNFSHMLPFYQKAFSSYDKQLNRICKCVEGKKNFLRVIDVGANLGDTIINIGIRNGEYLAIEGEKKFFKYLKKNVSSYKVYIENLYLTDNENDKSYNSVVEHGTAKIVRNSGKHKVSMTTLDSLMTKKYSGFHADVLKIDTDGFDFKVIKGGEGYITKERPLIYFEWSKEYLNLQGEVEMDVFPRLRKLGYNDLLIYDNFGNLVIKLHSDNHEQLRLLSDYTMKSDKRIYYFDILAIHKESEFTCEDFI